MNHQHRQRGFTLIEMMISMFLGLIILGGTITAYQAISSVSEQRDAVYELQNELLYVHQSMARAVAMAKDVEVNEGGAALTITPAGVAPEGCRSSINSDWVWRVDSSEEKESLYCNGKKVLTLSTPGVTHVAFDDMDKVCKNATNPCVRVTLKYTLCRQKDECDVKTLNFHLASRATSDSQGNP